MLKKMGRRSTNNLPELLGIGAVEKENPKKKNPEEFISIFIKCACHYMEGKGSILLLLGEVQPGSRFRKIFLSY